MKTAGIVFLLMSGALTASPSEYETITAGPFRMTAPKALTGGAVVQKVPLAPLYSAEQWAAAQRDPMLVLKSGYENRPQHWAIRLPKAAPNWYEADVKTAGKDPTAPQILIHKADEWAAAFSDGKVDAAKAAKVVARMRKDLVLWVKQPVNRITPGNMDAETAFDCLKKRIKFEGGSGVRGIVQWAVEADLVRRGQLHYLFLGLSDDGSCQIIATFPLGLPGLPDDSEGARHLGYSTTDYPKLVKEFNTYEGAVKKWLIANKNKFTPKLEELDGMMASLVAKRWE